MNGEFRKRMKRLESWTRSTSFGYAALKADEPILGVMAPQLALVESIYPDGQAGLTVLEEGVDPESVDRIARETPTLEKIEATYCGNHPGSYPLWVSCRSTPPQGDRVGVFEAKRLAGKPVGPLYTSDATASNPGMWVAHMVSRGAEYPTPWFAWRLAPAQKVRTVVISSALDWVEFVMAHHDDSGGVNWVAVAQRFDAVTITPRAVASTDCFEFFYRDRVIEPVFWGSECTVWLRWSFLRAQPVTLPIAAMDD